MIQIRNLFFNLGPKKMKRYFGFIPQEEDIRKQIVNDPDFDPAMLIGAYKDGELIGSAMGVYRPWKNEKTGFIKFIIVKENLRKSGIGSALLKACKMELEDKKCDNLIFASSSPLYFCPGVPKDESDSCIFLEKKGWQRISERINLNVDLSKMAINSPPLEKPVDISLAIADKDSKEKVLKFVDSEFSRSWTDETEDAFSANAQKFCFITTEKSSGDVLGFATVNTANPNWFGPMGVRPDMRGKGLGKLLASHALLRAKEVGLKQIVLPWINEKESFYRKIVAAAEKVIFYKYQAELG